MEKYKAVKNIHENLESFNQQHKLVKSELFVSGFKQPSCTYHEPYCHRRPNYEQKPLSKKSVNEKQKAKKTYLNVSTIN